MEITCPECGGSIELPPDDVPSTSVLCIDCGEQFSMSDFDIEDSECQ